MVLTGWQWWQNEEKLRVFGQLPLLLTFWLGIMYKEFCYRGLFWKEFRPFSHLLSKRSGNFNIF